MPIAGEHTLNLFSKLRSSERLADQIIRRGELHVEARHLRHALESEGSTVRAVLKNWISGLMESEPGQFEDPEEAENFVTRELLARLAETFPGAVNL